MLETFSEIIKHLGQWEKVRKNLNFSLTMKLSWQPGLIHAMGFIMCICQIVLGPLGGGVVDPKEYWNFEKLKIAILASGLV